MDGLILEIQRHCNDSNYPVDDILRQVKTAAWKLELVEMQEWVEAELNGYDGDLPPYRQVMGNPKALDEYRGGWIPIHADDSEFMDAIRTVHIDEPIGNIVDLLRNDHPTYSYPLPPSQVAAINQGSDFRTSRIIVELSRGSLVRILNNVRNKALDWALRLEQEGILGEGLTFSERDVAAAAAASNMQTKSDQTTNIINNGSIGSLSGVISSNNQTGDIIVNNQTLELLKPKLEELEKLAPDLVRAGADSQLPTALQRVLDEIENEPTRNSLTPLLKKVEELLMGAAGSILGTGAIQTIALLLSSL